MNLFEDELKGNIATGLTVNDSFFEFIAGWLAGVKGFRDDAHRSGSPASLNLFKEDLYRNAEIFRKSRTFFRHWKNAYLTCRCHGKLNAFVGEDGVIAKPRLNPEGR